MSSRTWICWFHGEIYQQQQQQPQQLLQKKLCQIKVYLCSQQILKKERDHPCLKCSLQIASNASSVQPSVTIKRHIVIAFMAIIQTHQQQQFPKLDFIQYTV